MHNKLPIHLGFHPDLPAQNCHHTLAQSQTCATVLSCVGTSHITAPEAIEHILRVLGCNPASCVGYSNIYLPLICLSRNVNPSAGRGVCLRRFPAGSAVPRAAARDHSPPPPAHRFSK